VDTKYNCNLPCTLLAIYYLMLIAHFVFPKNAKKISFKECLKPLGFGIIDSIANTVNIAAYEYSDAASINLILTLMMPSAMFFSAILLKKKYNFAQILTCIITIILVCLYGYIDKNN